MKKSILFLLVFLSINLCADAYYQVNYNSAGGITSTINTVPSPYGTQTYVNNSPYNYGSNALFSPNTIRRLSEEQRRRQNEKLYLENTKNININVNHSGYNPYQYNNGYYNRNYYNSYPNYGGVRYNRGINGLNTRGIILY